MKRTGKKEKEIYGYLREYECPQCGSIWVYSEDRNWLYPGSFQKYMTRENETN